MKRIHVQALLAGLLFSTALVSCADRASTAPAGALIPSDAASALKWGMKDKSHKSTGGASSNQAYLVRCEHHPAYEGEGDIGPAGGHIIAGPHRLIVPPGALLQTVHITATVPEGETVFVEFQPSGLTFRKPAGLILNASGCDVSQYYPSDVVYLNDAGEVVETIPAIYSNLWKTAAAPIWHFSGYALAW